MKKKQKEFLTDLWAEEFVVEHCCDGLIGHLCGLCGNTGIIDTRGHTVSPAGVATGGRFFCICPNGRAMKSSYGSIENMEVDDGTGKT